MTEEKEKEKIEEPQKEIKVKSSRRRKLGANAPKIIRVIIFGGLTVVILLLLMVSGLFDLEEVEVSDVEGNDLDYVDQEVLSTLVEEKYLDENFFFSDPNEIKQELIETDPYVEDAWIEKIAPRKLHLFVIEKEPYMYILFEELCILVDDENQYIVEYATVLNEEDESSADGSDPENIDEPYDCSGSAEYDGAYFVDFQGDHYEFIIKDKEFFIFDQIVQTTNLLDNYGITSDHSLIGDRLLVVYTDEGKSILIDPFDQFETQLKRLVLILNQIRWDDQDFVELDLRYKRPVMRTKSTI